MTFKANTPERDEAILKLAGELSAAIHGQHIDIAISAAALLIVAQCEAFPSAGTHDDLVDALSIAWQASDSGRGSRLWII